MGMVLPYWTPEQILREEGLHEKEDAPRRPATALQTRGAGECRPPQVSAECFRPAKKVRPSKPQNISEQY